MTAHGSITISQRIQALVKVLIKNSVETLAEHLAKILTQKLVEHPIKILDGRDARVSHFRNMLVIFSEVSPWERRLVHRIALA